MVYGTHEPIGSSLWSLDRLLEGIVEEYNSEKGLHHVFIYDVPLK